MYQYLSVFYCTHTFAPMIKSQFAWLQQGFPNFFLLWHIIISGYKHTLDKYYLLFKYKWFRTGKDKRSISKHTRIKWCRVLLSLLGNNIDISRYLYLILVYIYLIELFCVLYIIVLSKSRFGKHWVRGTRFAII